LLVPVTWPWLLYWAWVFYPPLGFHSFNYTLHYMSTVDDPNQHTPSQSVLSTLWTTPQILRCFPACSLPIFTNYALKWKLWWPRILSVESPHLHRAQGPAGIWYLDKLLRKWTRECYGLIQKGHLCHWSFCHEMPKDKGRSGDLLALGIEKQSETKVSTVGVTCDAET
jgi:hypothetical protein